MNSHVHVQLTVLCILTTVVILRTIWTFLRLILDRKRKVVAFLQAVALSQYTSGKERWLLSILFCEMKVGHHFQPTLQRFELFSKGFLSLKVSIGLWRGSDTEMDPI